MSSRNLQPYEVVKRTIDISASVVGIVVTLPIQAVVSAAIIILDGKPVLFRQVRPGLGGLPFEILKYRTMREWDETHQTDEERLTELGRVLRATSLDELPTLWNVLKGDMSIVGPRPLLVRYLNLYTAEQARRHLVRPGVTGLAQVSGRNSISWDEKFRLDVEYVRVRSFKIDLWILARTVVTVLARNGITQEDHATMSEFRGAVRAGS